MTGAAVTGPIRDISAVGVGTSLRQGWRTVDASGDFVGLVNIAQTSAVKRLNLDVTWALEPQANAATSALFRPAAMKEDKSMISAFCRKFLQTFEEFADKRLKALLETTRHGVVAGLAGGLAEIAWVTLYAGVTGADPATLSRGVTTAAGVSSLFPAAPVALGVTVHMALAMTLGIALSFGWRALSAHRLEIAGPFPFMLAALVGVWAVNFFVFLPIISPAFIHLAPYPVSLMSKVLFGLAAAEAFRRQNASALKARPGPYCAEPAMIKVRLAAPQRYDRNASEF